VGDADHGSTRNASAFLLACTALLPFVVAHALSSPAGRRSRVLHEDDQEPINRFAHGIIRRKVQQIVGRAGFHQQDREDLQQELLLHLLRRLPSYDPDIAHQNVFVTTVIERRVANILRDRRAKKRDWRRTTSLNPSGEGGTPDVGHDQHDERHGCQHRGDEELAQLALDVAEVLTSLPESLSSLADQLRSKSISEVTRESGVPRTTLIGHVRKLRQLFEKTGLQNYL
jgi:RNA polymerase sigma-70 factor (ECF subfamily)